MMTPRRFRQPALIMIDKFEHSHLWCCLVAQMIIFLLRNKLASTRFGLPFSSRIVVIFFNRESSSTVQEHTASFCNGKADNTDLINGMQISGQRPSHFPFHWAVQEMHLTCAPFSMAFMC